MLLALRPAVLPFGRNSWPSAGAEMPPGPGHQPIDSPSSTLNRPLCCECPNVRQGEGARTLQGKPPARSFSSWGCCPCPFGAQSETLTVGLLRGVRTEALESEDCSGDLRSACVRPCASVCVRACVCACVCVCVCGVCGVGEALFYR